MWVERLTDEWIATSSSMFATAWPGFHKFSRRPSFMIFFTGSPKEASRNENENKVWRNLYPEFSGKTLTPKF